jgi:II/X family phage/plasmid replication protein
MRVQDNTEALPPRLRSVNQLWRDGHDLRELFPTRTFYRHRKALLAHGVDIALKQPRDVSNVVPLVVTLVGREVGVPDWARGTPLYFEPAAAVA